LQRYVTRLSFAVNRKVARRLRVESEGPDVIPVFGRGSGGGGGGAGGGGGELPGGHASVPGFGAAVRTNVAQIVRPSDPPPGRM
jgi:hypothetical protein